MIRFMRGRSFLPFLMGFMVCFLVMDVLKPWLLPSILSHHSRYGRPVILAFGDSITEHAWDVSIEGWLAKLGDLYIRRADVLNRGFSGYNTRWGVDIVDSVVVKAAPDFVILFFGANDAVEVGIVQHVPLDEYIDNLHIIIQRIRKSIPNIDILLITPPPIDENKLIERNKLHKKAILLDRTNNRTRMYVQASLEVAKQVCTCI